MKEKKMDNLIVKLGGRKFLMALAVIGVALFLEAKTDKGLSPTMATFLGGIVAAFSAANFATTAKHMESKAGMDSALHAKVDKMGQAIERGFSPEAVQNLTDVLVGIQSGVEDVKKLNGEIGRAVVNMTKRS